MSNPRLALLLAALFCLFALVSELDYQDEVRGWAGSLPLFGLMGEEGFQSNGQEHK